MSVVANSEPLLKPCIICTVLETASRKIAVTTDPNGLCPCVESSAAFSTKNAASTGTSLAMITSVTKLLKLASIELSQGLLTVPPSPGVLTPCAANHDSNWGNVSRITDQTIHRWKRPPDSKFTPLSDRSARPASTIVHIAAGTARSSSSANRSESICGVVMALPRPPPVPRLLHSRRTLGDPELDQTGQS